MLMRRLCTRRGRDCLAGFLSVQIAAGAVLSLAPSPAQAADKCWPPDPAVPRRLSSDAEQRIDRRLKLSAQFGKAALPRIFRTVEAAFNHRSPVEAVPLPELPGGRKEQLFISVDISPPHSFYQAFLLRLQVPGATSIETPVIVSPGADCTWDVH